MKRASIKKTEVQPAKPSAALSKKGRRQAAIETRLRSRWWLACGALLLAAGLLRLLFPDLKPLHHDEGVNGLFMMNLFRAGSYKYDPANYHGPSLYYFALITTSLNAFFYGKEGLSTSAIRLVPMAFGIGLIWLVITLRRYLGDLGAWFAAALLAVSPAMVYYSRYFIHEIPFIFLTLALVAAALRFRETAQPRYLMLASASAALMFATKETCIISFVVLVLAWLCAKIYLVIRKSPAAESAASPVLPMAADAMKEFWRWLGPAALLFISISVLLFSSFFTNFPQGVKDSVRTFQIWINTGTKTPTYRAPWDQYLIWILKGDLSILVLGAVGVALALWKASNRFAVFIAFWAMGITAAYALIPYKTPWIAINMILPLGIMAGYAVDQGYRSGSLVRAAAVIALTAALAGSLYQAVDFSFIRYDDDSVPYVYAHTSRQLEDLVAEINSVAARSPEGKNISVTIASPEYWPLPWYLRDYPQGLFWGHMIPNPGPILIASSDQAGEVQRSFGPFYRRYKTYDLRPGNALILFLRRDLRP